MLNKNPKPFRTQCLNLEEMGIWCFGYIIKDKPLKISSMESIQQGTSLGLGGQIVLHLFSYAVTLG